MRFWIGTAIVFLGPLLAGLTLRPFPSVIVYAGIMVFWFLKVQPVKAPTPGRLAFLVGLLTVLAALIHTVGALGAAVFGILWQLPFWLPAVVSVLGVFVARPPSGFRAGADGAPETATPDDAPPQRGNRPNGDGPPPRHPDNDGPETDGPGTDGPGTGGPGTDDPQTDDPDTVDRDRDGPDGGGDGRSGS